MSSSEQPESNDPVLSAHRDALEGEHGGLDAATLDAMFTQVEAVNHRNDAGIVGWLRTRSTASRQLMLLGAAALLAGLTALTGLRANLHELSSGYFGGALAVFAVGLVAATLLALRPLHQRALGAAMERLVAGTVLFGLLLVAAFSPAVVTDAGGNLFAGAVHCALLGTAMALPVLLVARLLDRGSLSGPLMSAVAAGVAANLTLMLRCPSTDPAHCVAGHFGVALLLVGLMGVLRRFSR